MDFKNAPRSKAVAIAPLPESKLHVIELPEAEVNTNATGASYLCAAFACTLQYVRSEDLDVKTGRGTNEPIPQTDLVLLGKKGHVSLDTKQFVVDSENEVPVGILRVSKRPTRRGSEKITRFVFTPQDGVPRRELTDQEKERAEAELGNRKVGILTHLPGLQAAHDQVLATENTIPTWFYETMPDYTPEGNSGGAAEDTVLAKATSFASKLGGKKTK